MTHERDAELFRRSIAKKSEPYTSEEFDERVKNAKPSRFASRGDAQMYAAIEMAYDYNPVGAASDPPWIGKKRAPSFKQRLEWWKGIATGLEGREALDEFADVNCSTCKHSMPVVWCCPNRRALMPNAHGLYYEPHRCHYERKEDDGKATA